MCYTNTPLGHISVAAFLQKIYGKWKCFSAAFKSPCLLRPLFLEENLKNELTFPQFCRKQFSMGGEVKKGFPLKIEKTSAKMVFRSATQMCP